MEDKLLQEPTSVLKPVIENAWRTAKRNLNGGDPREAFLDNFRVQIDQTAVDISNRLYKLNLAMSGYTNEAERHEFECSDDYFENESLLEVNENDYLRHADGGYEFWDGIQWVRLSDQANIKIEISQDSDNNNGPAVRVWANDTKTKTSVVFVDNDLLALGWDVGYTLVGDGFDSVA